MTQMLRRPRVRERKLGREKAEGLCWREGKLGIVEVDPRLPAKEALIVYLHEMLHHYCPRWSEAKVDKTSTDMAGVLWRAGFRRIRP